MTPATVFVQHELNGTLTLKNIGESDVVFISRHLGYPDNLRKDIHSGLKPNETVILSGPLVINQEQADIIRDMMGVVLRGQRNDELYRRARYLGLNNIGL